MKSLLLFFLSISLASAQAIRLSPSLFSSADFKKSFVGSYGFLPLVEPKINRDEADFLAELSEVLAASRFGEAEQRIKGFIYQQRNPPPAEKKTRKNPNPEPAKEPREVSPAVIFTLGNLYFQNDQVTAAEAAYRDAIKRHPSYRRAHKNLALLLATQDKIKEAKPHLMKAIELGESDHRSFGLLGYALLKEEKMLAAEAAYRQAYLFNPDEKDWKLGLAQTLLGKESWVEAATMLQTLIDENPENALFWKQQANCYIQSGEIMRAAENYEALRLKGLADEASLNQLGDIYANQDDPLLALGAYLAAMRKSETVNVPRSLKSARYLVQLNAPTEASRLIADLRAKAGSALTREQKIDTLMIEGDIASALGDLPAATARLTAALELDTTKGATRVSLGQLLARRAAEEADEKKAAQYHLEARKFFLIAVDDSDQKVAFQANLRLAQLYVKDGKYLKALPRLEQAVRLKTGSKQALEQYLRRVQRAAEREKASAERLRLEREEKMAR